MKDHHQIQLQIVSLKQRHDSLLEKYRRITDTDLAARSPGDNNFMMQSLGWKELRAIENEISALEWVIERR